MRSSLLLCLLVFLIFLTSCRVNYGYFQSPFQTNTSSYKTIPLHSDSARSAIYASGVFTIGSANDRWRDGMGGFLGSVYRSHTSRYVQGYYGLTGMIGGYHIKSYGIPDPLAGITYDQNKNLDESLIDSMAGSKIWGGMGITGGIDFSLPYNRNEWRILVLEGSWQQEFGRYLDFRKNIPDTAANLIDHRKHYFTISVGTEVVVHTRKGQVGYKMAVISSTRNLYGFNKDRLPFTRTPGYWSQTFHLSVNKVTGFTQLNFGTYAMSWQLGFSYLLGR
jgi:hypothetical protein